MQEEAAHQLHCHPLILLLVAIEFHRSYCSRHHSPDTTRHSPDTLVICLICMPSAVHKTWALQIHICAYVTTIIHILTKYTYTHTYRIAGKFGRGKVW